MLKCITLRMNGQCRNYTGNAGIYKGIKRFEFERKGTVLKKDSNYKGHCHMSMHVDDFLIVGSDSESVINEFKEKFEIRNDELNLTMHLGLE